MDILDPKVVDRFWKKVVKTGGCWLWTGSTAKSYGNFMVRGRIIRASRFSYALHVGPIGDLYVCHRCDNPRCVRPDHLFLGTAKDNLMDAISKGRFPAPRDEAKAYESLKASGSWFKNGELHPNAKLTGSQATEIRAIYAAGGISQGALAKRFGVSRKAIDHILHRRTWKEAA